MVRGITVGDVNGILQLAADELAEQERTDPECGRWASVAARKLVCRGGYRRMLGIGRENPAYVAWRAGHMPDVVFADWLEENGKCAALAAEFAYRLRWAADARRRWEEAHPEDSAAERWARQAKRERMVAVVRG